jgi:hypothetical protein
LRQLNQNEQYAETITELLRGEDLVNDENLMEKNTNNNEKFQQTPERLF